MGDAWHTSNQHKSALAVTLLGLSEGDPHLAVPSWSSPPCYLCMAQGRAKLSLCCPTHCPPFPQGRGCLPLTGWGCAQSRAISMLCLEYPLPLALSFHTYPGHSKLSQSALLTWKTLQQRPKMLPALGQQLLPEGTSCQPAGSQMWTAVCTHWAVGAEDGLTKPPVKFFQKSESHTSAGNSALPPS